MEREYFGTEYAAEQQLEKEGYEFNLSQAIEQGHPSHRWISRDGLTAADIRLNSRGFWIDRIA